MTDRFPDARVLVTAPGPEDGPSASGATRATGEATRVAEDVRAGIGAEAVVKRGVTAVEYVREFAPLLDCVVCLADDAATLAALADGEPGLPLVVYGEAAPGPADRPVRRDGGTDALVARVADRIERNRERTRLAEANAKLTALNTYTREITGCESCEEVVDRVVDAVTGALAYDRCVVGLVEAGEIVPYGNLLPDESDVTFTPDEGVAGLTYRTGESQVVDDYAAHPARGRESAWVTSVVSVAVGDHGVLQVTAPDRAAFDERDAEFLEIVAAHADEALSRLEREAALRTERDRLHAFFDGLPAPTVYVESVREDDPVLREVNAAYESAFDAAPVGDPVESAFPTAAERRLFGGSLRATRPVSESVRRDTAGAADAPLTVTLVPVRTAGPAAAGFGVYVDDVTLP